MSADRMASDRPDVAKLPTGGEVFDQIPLGGLPRGRTSLIAGGPGSGKTVCVPETLVHGPSSGERQVVRRFRCAGPLSRQPAVVVSRHFFFAFGT